MKREHRKPTRSEWESITSRNPVVRKFPPEGREWAVEPQRHTNANNRKGEEWCKHRQTLWPSAASPEAWRHLGLSPCPAPKEGWTPCYVRFGELPPDGCSRNWKTGVLEAGVSCFKGYETPEGNYLVDPQENLYQLGDYLQLKRQRLPVFVVGGEQLGIGCAGEPLLVNITHCEPIPANANVSATIEVPKSLVAFSHVLGFLRGAWW